MSGIDRRSNALDGTSTSAPSCQSCAVGRKRPTNSRCRVTAMGPQTTLRVRACLSETCDIFAVESTRASFQNDSVLDRMAELDTRIQTRTGNDALHHVDSADKKRQHRQKLMLVSPRYIQRSRHNESRSRATVFTQCCCILPTACTRMLE